MLNRIHPIIFNEYRECKLQDAAYARGEFLDIQDSIWAGIRDNGGIWQGGVPQQRLVFIEMVGYFYDIQNEAI